MEIFGKNSLVCVLRSKIYHFNKVIRKTGALALRSIGTARKASKRDENIMRYLFRQGMFAEMF
jgi:hypothetical protein